MALAWFKALSRCSRIGTALNTSYAHPPPMILPPESIRVVDARSCHNSGTHQVDGGAGPRAGASTIRGVSYSWKGKQMSKSRHPYWWDSLTVDVQLPNWDSRTMKFSLVSHCAGLEMGELLEKTVNVNLTAFEEEELLQAVRSAVRSLLGLYRTDLGAANGGQLTLDQ